MKTLFGLFGMIAAFVAIAGTASTAHAKCGPSPTQMRNPYRAYKPKPAAAAAAKTVLPAADGATQAEPTIAGLWHVEMMVDGEVVDEGFDVWNSDGTEILNDTTPTLAGNVCLGAWSKPAPLTYSLKHPSWIYDDMGMHVTGIATILERVVLDQGGNSFAGQFRIEISNFDGKILESFEGKIVGTRITPDDSAFGK